MSTAAKRVEIAGTAHAVALPEGARALKRAFDLLFSVALLVLAFPVIVVLAALVRIHDGGPAFYRRRVVGLKEEFDAFKLRTMHVDADRALDETPALQEEFEINFKLHNDPRVTSLGKFLRRTSLDELPQLWNVLRGQMSLVGPRMISPAELDKYRGAAWIFHFVKPGLTGYWQVQARHSTSYDQRVELDLFYVEHWTLLLDFRILLKTPARVIRGTGA